MFVGCKLPHGLIVDHNGAKITLNGGNVGYDPEQPFRNGAAPDSFNRTSGVGLTELRGEDETAFVDWFDMSGKGEGPVQSGMIFFVDKKADADKEARSLEGVATGLDGLDTDKLDGGLSTDADVVKNKKG